MDAGDRNRVDDVERIDALGFQIHKSHQHPIPVAVLHERRREKIGLGQKGLRTADIPRPDQGIVGHRPGAVQSRLLFPPFGLFVGVTGEHQLDTSRFVRMNEYP